MTHPTLPLAEALALAFALGTTLWFFFVQTPALLLGLGKTRFLPLQMRLVKVYARALAVATTLVLVAAWLRDGALVWALVAAASAWVNLLLVVPRAVRSGGQALREVRQGGQDEATVASFVSVGGGEPTKLFHRLVVVFVLTMTGGLLVEGADLVLRDEVTAPPHLDHAMAHGSAHHAPQGEAHPRWPADPATWAHVHALHARVQVLRPQIAAAAPLAPDDAAALREAYAAIFRDCTMEGPAHEALHALLLPLGAALDTLDADPAKALAALDEGLSRFDTAFEAAAP